MGCLYQIIVLVCLEWMRSCYEHVRHRTRDSFSFPFSFLFYDILSVDIAIPSYHLRTTLPHSCIAFLCIPSFAFHVFTITQLGTALHWIPVRYSPALLFGCTYILLYCYTARSIKTPVVQLLFFSQFSLRINPLLHLNNERTIQSQLNRLWTITLIV